MTECITYADAEGKASIHITMTGPTKVVATQPEPERWCFGERKRQPGMWELKDEIEPSYYDPFWVYRCDGCGKDRRFLG
jgi:hypothetical protein